MTRSVLRSPDGVSYACCLSALRSRLVVSRFGRATCTAETVSQSALCSSRDGRRRMMTQPSRHDYVARDTSPAFSCGTLCYMHGPAHQGSHPRPSPWLRPSANASRPEAPFLRCTRPVGGPTTTTNDGNVSHLKERLVCLVSRRRGVTSRTGHPSENHKSAPDASG